MRGISSALEPGCPGPSVAATTLPVANRFTVFNNDRYNYDFIEFAKSGPQSLNGIFDRLCLGRKILDCRLNCGIG